MKNILAVILIILFVLPVYSEKLKLDPEMDYDEILKCIHKESFADTSEKGKFQLRENECTDGIKRPWVLYVPSNYNPKKEAPVLIWLHGGVSRKSISEEPVKWARENSFIKEAEKNNWIMIFPYGQLGATWWDETGMSNIKEQLLTVKKEFNIDDDRVVMGGFSDGASASFLHGMVSPDPYSCLFALNGHMGVGSLDGNLPTYAVNFFNTPVFATTTFNDRLYPSSIMRKTIKMANEAGGKIFYHELKGRHKFDFADKMMKQFICFINRHPRDPLSEKIIWECADLKFGKCKWLEITGIDNIPAEKWHVDHNTVLEDSKITFGFFPEMKGIKKGVGVGKVIEKTFSHKSGLKTGDIMTAVNNTEINDMNSLDEFKKTLKRGDDVDLVVRRFTGVKTEEITLHGKLPEIQYYNLFKRERPSALVHAQFAGNTFIVKSSRCSSFRIYIHPEMVNLEENVTIIHNKKVVFNEKITVDKRFLIENYEKNRDRKMIFVNYIDINE